MTLVGFEVCSNISVEIPRTISCYLTKELKAYKLAHFDVPGAFELRM